MAEVNVIDWHVNPFRADRWYKVWRPALERSAAFGATSFTLTRSEDDHLHFIQTTVWDSRADFDRYWSSDEVSRAREDAIDYYNKPLLPAWHMLLVRD
ncbi:MAG: antibiotic biosynthesis monooxygenase [Solirubrobacterales bacterium]